ncbi:MAG TPA: amidase [Planctomycetota bacterium]
MYCAILILVCSPAWNQEPPAAPTQAPPVVTPERIQEAGALLGLGFSPEEAAQMLRGVAGSLRSFEALREREIGNGDYPVLLFDPLPSGVSYRPDRTPTLALTELALPVVERPADLEELAFADIRTLAALIRGRKVGCVELTQMYLARLRKLDATLHCVITFTEERALAQAAALDRELAEGKWRGPLHGIPWGAKDLLAAKGYRTTWGAKPFEEQVLDLDATVVARLDAAGAVLIAKLTLGALAWGDVWFGGMTRNPWNPEQGSSGSSAGSASATAAGGVVFAIGSETLGSIVSPSTRCGNTSLRPTFGRVSRHGAMALSWSMDKLGPLCRSVDDAAIVLAAIQGPDGLDPTVKDLPFGVPAPGDVRGWKVGYLEGAFERNPADAQVLDDLRALGAELVPVQLPDYPLGAINITLNAEAACAFDEITRDGLDEQLVRQVAQAWPNVFRTARLVPAVEYLRANRLRLLLMRDLDQVFAEIDVLVHPSFAGGVLTMTNLTGHPTLVAPHGFRDNGTPESISFTGRLYGEARLLALARAWQESTAHHLRHPEL